MLACSLLSRLVTITGWCVLLRDNVFLSILREHKYSGEKPSCNRACMPSLKQFLLHRDNPKITSGSQQTPKQIHSKTLYPFKRKVYFDPHHRVLVHQTRRKSKVAAFPFRGTGLVIISGEYLGFRDKGLCRCYLS